MQTKGGGKHDILLVGRATATTCVCLWDEAPRTLYRHVPRSGFAPDAEHEGVHGASELTSADVESASRKSARERPRGRQRRVQLERRSDDGYDPEEEPN